MSKYTLLRDGEEITTPLPSVSAHTAYAFACIFKPEHKWMLIPVAIGNADPAQETLSTEGFENLGVKENLKSFCYGDSKDNCLKLETVNLKELVILKVKLKALGFRWRKKENLWCAYYTADKATPEFRNGLLNLLREIEGVPAQSSSFPPIPAQPMSDTAKRIIEIAMRPKESK